MVLHFQRNLFEQNFFWISNRGDILGHIWVVVQLIRRETRTEISWTTTKICPKASSLMINLCKLSLAFTVHLPWPAVPSWRPIRLSSSTVGQKWDCVARSPSGRPSWTRTPCPPCWKKVSSLFLFSLHFDLRSHKFRSKLGLKDDVVLATKHAIYNLHALSHLPSRHIGEATKLWIMDFC